MSVTESTAGALLSSSTRSVEIDHLVVWRFLVAGRRALDRIGVEAVVRDRLEHHAAAELLRERGADVVGFLPEARQRASRSAPCGTPKVMTSSATASGCASRTAARVAGGSSGRISAHATITSSMWTSPTGAAGSGGSARVRARRATARDRVAVIGGPALPAELGERP